MLCTRWWSVCAKTGCRCSRCCRPTHSSCNQATSPSRSTIPPAPSARASRSPPPPHHHGDGRHGGRTRCASASRWATTFGVACSAPPGSGACACARRGSVPEHRDGSIS
jgi:hypothetical protein